MTIEPDTVTLADELVQLEAELAALNERRVSIYRRSLEAAQEDKAAPDLIANAMLAGPLNEANTIKWPVELSGIAWNSEAPQVYQRASSRAWCQVVLQTEPDVGYLGLHLADVATGVQAQIGEGAILHLSHVGHSPALFVPALNRVVMGSECQWKPLEDPETLTTLHGPESSYVWHDRAWRDLEAAKAEADDAEGEAEDS